MTSTEPAEVFISYSHDDEELRAKLDDRLKILHRRGLVSAWHDREITGGADWRRQIDDHIESAHVILLLISSSFLASDYAVDVEAARAIERHRKGEARVVPVILGDVSGWDSIHFGGFRLGDLQALPKDGKPVEDWDSQAQAFSAVADGIEAVVLDVAPRPGDVSRGAVRTVWNIRRRNPHFTGRTDLLGRLEAALRAAGNGQTIVAIVGKPGFGKTQVAVEYAHRHRADYGHVFSVPAEEQATLIAGVVNLAKALGLRERRDQQVAVDVVRSRLEELENWLLILDNAEQASDVEGVLPVGGSGHVLITSRNAGWRALGAEVIELDAMTPAEAAQFLLSRTGQEDEVAAVQVAEQLLGYPLALEQAAAYCEQTRTPFARYLERVERDNMPTDGRPHGYEHTVMATWRLAFAEVERASPAAVELLNLCAFVDADDIPRVLVSAGGRLDLVPAALRDEVAFDDAVAVLAGYSHVTPTDDGLALHRIVQQMARQRLAEDERKRWLDAAVQVLLAAFPDHVADVQTWPTCRRLLPHATALRRHSEHTRPEPVALAKLLDRVGVYLHSSAQFARAQETFQEALVLLEREHRAQDAVAATVRNHFGALLRDLDDLGGALRHHEAALALHKATLGEDAPEVADDLVSLGTVLLERGDLTAAKELVESALAIRKKELTPDERAIADTLTVIGDLLLRLGNIVDALGYFGRALVLYRGVYAPEHPDVTELTYLAELLQNLEEEPHSESAKIAEIVTVCEQAYGKEHPKVADWRNLLADALLKVGDLEGAATNYEHALTIDERAYGSRHRKVGKDLLRLFTVDAARGNTNAAKAALERASSIFERVPTVGDQVTAPLITALDDALAKAGAIPAATAEFEQILRIVGETNGDAGPAFASALEHLGAELHEAEDLPRAKDVLERARSIFERTYGPQHTRVAQCLNRLGGVQRASGDLPGAKASFERAAEAHERAGDASRLDLMNDLLGLYSVLKRLEDRSAPKVLERVHEVAARAVGVERLFGWGEALAAAGDRDGAAKTYERALTMLEEAHGTHHPTIAAALNRVGDALTALGDPAAARDHYTRALEIHSGEYGPEHLEVAQDLWTRLFPVLAGLGELDVAEETLERAVTMLELTYGSEASNVAYVRTQGWLTLGDSALRLDQLDDAEVRYATGLARAREHEDVAAEAAFLARLGGLAAVRGDRDRALEHIRASADVQRAAGSGHPYWRVVRDSSRALRSADERGTLEDVLHALRKDLVMADDQMRTFRPQLAAVLPDDWFAKESLTLLAPDGQANLIASSEPLDPSIDTERYAEVQGDLLRSEFPAYQELKFEETELLGERRGYIREFSWTPHDGQPITQIQLYYAEGSRGYTATATTPSVHFPALQVELRELLKSLTIES